MGDVGNIEICDRKENRIIMSSIKIEENAKYTANKSFKFCKIY
jgi:hypothetical protein